MANGVGCFGRLHATCVFSRFFPRLLPLVVYFQQHHYNRQDHASIRVAASQLIIPALTRAACSSKTGLHHPSLLVTRGAPEVSVDRMRESRW
jgi:hypothetical protein